ncbi:MAG: phytase [Thermoanaerobaculales bacterium]|nr:phytase [Thermoanaerobaculales bacterium]
MPTNVRSGKTEAARFLLTVSLVIFLTACAAPEQPPAAAQIGVADAVVPVVVTEKSAVDTDDPAIWINPDDPSKSLILGTDKGGSVFVFDLDGKIIPEKTVSGMGRMNNIDVAYGFPLGGETIDIALATDRNEEKIRAFRLPDMTPIDNGGIPTFVGETDDRRAMGLAIYTRPSDGAFFAIVSRKFGQSGSYLWQYLLEDAGDGTIKATKVRAFGEFVGGKEIEALAVDNELGYVYYSDETAGVHKYLADPDAPNADQELAFFGTDGFSGDQEGISIYKVNDGTGYVLVSDQQANTFRVFTREGEPDDPHNHQLVKIIKVSTNESDGSDVTNIPVDDRFPSGLFVAMSDDRTFHYYSWDDFAGDDLKKAPNGVVQE